MRIELTVDVFARAESLPPILNLLQCFATGRHEWQATPESIAAMEQYLKKNLTNLASTYAQLGEKATVGAAWNVGSGSRTVKISSADLDDAIEDLYRPAVLVLENATSDGHFIRAIATTLGHTRVIRALEKDWLSIRQAGGSGQLKVIAEHEFTKFHLHIRIVVLFDSDSMRPGHETQNHRDAKALESIGITAHVLQLREAENYVPTRVLAASGPQRETSTKLTHLKTFSLEQRGHFDMKKGFPHDQDGPRVHAAQQELFADLTPTTLRRLCGGFGHDLLKLLAEQADAMTPEDFARIGVEPELRSLLSKIEAVI